MVEGLGLRVLGFRVQVALHGRGCSLLRVGRATTYQGLI